MVNRYAIHRREAFRPRTDPLPSGYRLIFNSIGLGIPKKGSWIGAFALKVKIDQRLV